MATETSKDAAAVTAGAGLASAAAGHVPSKVRVSREAAVLMLPAASLAAPAARSTVTAPSADGVTVNVYALPEPVRPDPAPLPTMIEATPNPLTGSENVAVTVNAALAGSK